METLPSEILIHILNLLPNNELKNICVVSKLFDKLCKEIKITINLFLISQYNIINCLSFSSKHFKVVKLVLPPDVLISSQWINFAISALPHLECLALHCGNTFKKEHLQKFFKFKNLKEIEMYHMTLNADDFKDIYKLTKLKKLKIRSSLFTNYEKLFKYTPELEELKLIGTSSINIDDFSKLKNLKVINFSASESFIVIRYLNPDLIQKISKNCKKLEKINLNFCKNIDPESLKIIFQDCNIKSLRLQYYDKLNKEMIKTIGNLDQLEVLDISHCSNIKNVEKITKCYRLKRLYAFGLQYVDKEFFTNTGTYLANLVNLKITFNQTNCRNILTSLSKCKNLKKLFLRGADFLPEDFDYFAMHAKYYKQLDLGLCQKLTGSNLNKLNTKYMKILNINSKNFTKQNFIDLIERSFFLQKIYFYHADFLNVDFFQNICKNIKYVYVNKLELTEDLYNYLSGSNNILFM